VLPAVLLAPLLAVRLWSAGRVSSDAPAHQAPPGERVTVHVLRAVDGDTLLLEGGERVRLLGVDTPETKIPNQPPEPFGPEASDFTARFIQGGTAALEFDVERFDKYGRTLAYVFVDGRMLNEELIREGFSAAQLQYPYRSDRKRRFALLEREARDQRRGLWSRAVPAAPTAPGRPPLGGPRPGM
jgi:micrococcal nuclease